MRTPLGLVGSAVLLLLSLGPQTCLAQSSAGPRVEILDRQVVISGSVGGSPFQGSFKIRAVGAGVEELTFAPNNLREVVGGRAWLTPANIQITPDVKTIGPG